MSKVLYVCSRNPNFESSLKRKLTLICYRLVPDNIDVPPVHRVRVEKDTAYAVSMSNGFFLESQRSVLLGVIDGPHGMRWDKPREKYPDGNYAIFRANEDELEVISDCVATRTIWYYHDKGLFIASTSQRAIVLFLQSFKFDERVIPWLLSTGTLGPQFSWDNRIKRLQADSSVILDKKRWSISVNQHPITFSEVSRKVEDHRKVLSDAIMQSVLSLCNLDFNKWILPLSGGYDSRAILCFIRDSFGLPSSLKAVTWGLEQSIEVDGNDAKVARDIARVFGVPHEYYHTDLSTEPVETIINRFMLCSEGRIDHIAGYMDGMAIWNLFHENKISGVIRGDEGFGWTPVSSDLTVRIGVGCGLCSDFKNLSGITSRCDLPVQEVPEELLRRDAESLATWRDRLYHGYRLPTILAALSDIKFSYVDQVNPLLSRSIMNAVRTLPDHLRTNKSLFKSIVKSKGPNIPFANMGANSSARNILRNPFVVDLLESSISSRDAANMFGSKFTHEIVSGIKVENSNVYTRQRGIKEMISYYLPKSMRNMLKDSVVSPMVDGNILAFRVLIILKMYKMLSADASSIGSQE